MMIRTGAVLIALMGAVSVAQAADMSSGRDVITVYDGSGEHMVITRDRDGGETMGSTGERQVLEYRDASGALVRVVADHPVTRAEVEARLATAEREGQAARAEGRRAAEEGRREAEQGRREAEEGRREAQSARLEADRARAEGERAAAEGRREADAARREAQRARDEAAREVVDSR